MSKREKECPTCSTITRQFKNGLCKYCDSLGAKAPSKDRVTLTEDVNCCDGCDGCDGDEEWEEECWYCGALESECDGECEEEDSDW